LTLEIGSLLCVVLGLLGLMFVQMATYVPLFLNFVPHATW
jgi:hypothetical protein